ncbi:primosomal protein N' [Sphaerospermopsis aphanizomenoides BCCUSP55]|uniref:primosomal protein N' n=1 Tax=Sphaerospermopsis aphanizomenoides TaxID=459663 RepID=UPI001907C858|nr:primosomal protein N' [Sphaerospermopsis aphanizomenoides]MBK1986781.1 primosomal protein N' [Sphaerospermopsis aphanizomenoides BCCUSP55]
MYIKDVNLSAVAVAEPGGSYQLKTTFYRWIEVLADFPINPTEYESEENLYVYHLPEGLEVKPGDIVTVPFGANLFGGIVIRLLAQPPEKLSQEKIRDVEDVIQRGFFPETYWKLMEKVSHYYYTKLIQVVRTALPPGLLRQSQRRIRLTLAGAAVPTQNTNLMLIDPMFGTPLMRAYKHPDSYRVKFYLFNSIPKDRLIKTLTLLSFQNSVGKVKHKDSNKILQLLQQQINGDYSFFYLRSQLRQSQQFNYRIRELIQQGLVESYLEPPRLVKPKLEKVVTLIGQSYELNLGKKQQEIIDVLRRQGGEMWQSELLQTCSTSTSVLKALEQKGCIVIEEREILRREQNPLVAGDQAKSLTQAQTHALETIKSLNGFAQILLHGVTGSGKTEVYLQAIAPLLNQGKSALVLVPEIGLTPQLTDRFRARFGNKVQVYHSALSDGERYDTWRQMFTGEPQVVIGTRSAIFSPLPHLGLIILDEEHDSSFKQDSPIPTYHARTVAQWRAELENCPLILGSATPSLESWVSVKVENTSPTPQLPTFQYLSLPERINSRPLPPVEIVDMRRELQEGNRSMFSRSLQEALEQLKERKQQGILFIHRRGHSTFVSCRSCGYVLECPNCDVSLAYHHVEEGAPQLLRCHYCNYGQAHPKYCPQCSSPYLKFFGSGTQRVAQELNRQFPHLKLIRFDSDTTRNKGAHRNLLTQFANGEADLLVGTQMLTKGLDLPQVTLVGVVAADGLLHLSDYRASERAFQTLTQVAGRAGRGEDPGRVIMQTYTPEHPVIEAVKTHDYHSFCDAELAQRQALNYPPYGRLILLRLSCLDPIQVQNTAQIIATNFSDQEGLEILGPAPASILRVANRYRWQILLKFTADALPNLPDWEEIRKLCPYSVSLTIDVDPINIM